MQFNTPSKHCVVAKENLCDTLAIVLLLSTVWGSIVLSVALLVRTGGNWLFHSNKNPVMVWEKIALLLIVLIFSNM